MTETRGAATPDANGPQDSSPGAIEASGPAVRVTVVIPVWNSARWLDDCLAALDRQSYRDFEVVLVDNGSTDGAVDRLDPRGFALHLVSRPTNEGFAAAVNHGIRRSEGDYVALLNADTRVGHEWLERLVAALDEAAPEVAAAAPCMLRMDDPDRVDNAGDSFSWYGSATKVGHGEPATDYAQGGEALSVSAGAALYRREFLDHPALFDRPAPPATDREGRRTDGNRGGPFDERFESYLEDVDLGLRGRLLGFRYLYVPQARVLHAGHGSALARGRYVRLMTRNRLLVQLKVLPGGQMLRHLPQWLLGQGHFLVVYRRPLQSLRGYLGFLGCLPHALAERRRLRAAAVLPDAAWSDLLSNELGEPTVHELLARRRG